MRWWCNIKCILHVHSRAIGKLQSCGRLLFRVEAAVLIGVTYPTCTSMLASWNVPSKKKQIIPWRIKDFLFKSESYTKKSLELDTVDSLKKNAERQTFLKCQIVNLLNNRAKSTIETLKDLFNGNNRHLVTLLLF